MQHFIEQANHYGKQRTPFFFLIDFEKEKPLIKVMYFLQDLKKNGGSYQTVEKQLHRIDDIEKKIIFKDRTTIQFDDIISVEYEGF